MLRVQPLPAFEDNYIWCLSQPEHAFVVVVDPGDGNIVQQWLTEQQLQLAAILITHHHKDHTGGIAMLQAAWPEVRVIGPQAEAASIPWLTEQVGATDKVVLAELNLSFEVLALPGHTLGHIGFYVDELLFCGDTLFSAGCGRLFEGSPAQMLQSLEQLAALPGNTRVYCTHEYTMANLAFAMTAEPDNQALMAYQQSCQQKRQQGLPTLPSTLAQELAINPFLRCKNRALQQRWQTNDSLALFTRLRAAKDLFKS
ncbi:hydroxyacylglutathione hydrolase [Arsukibacterium sp.]|uniref:hydroxyacylglutathione hydrolase n=1 Tax=Arsukibacterium sp. TaxID=1977258 RepID=UPI002FDABD3F